MFSWLECCWVPEAGGICKEVQCGGIWDPSLFLSLPAEHLWRAACLWDAPQTTLKVKGTAAQTAAGIGTS